MLVCSTFTLPLGTQSIHCYTIQRSRYFVTTLALLYYVIISTFPLIIKCCLLLSAILESLHPHWYCHGSISHCQFRPIAKSHHQICQRCWVSFTRVFLNCFRERRDICLLRLTECNRRVMVSSESRSQEAPCDLFSLLEPTQLPYEHSG